MSKGKVLDWKVAYGITVQVLKRKEIPKDCSLPQLEQAMQDTKEIQKVSSKHFGKTLTDKELDELRVMLPDISNRLRGITP
jgi:hypothetical protein